MNKRSEKVDKAEIRPAEAMSYIAQDEYDVEVIMILGLTPSPTLWLAFGNTCC